MWKALILVAVLLIVGCETVEEKLALLEVEHTPLNLDPTENIAIGRWWSNGNELLDLRRNSAYRLYPNQNRYHQPVERGRWAQMSYAVLRLEPYTMFDAEARRVDIEKIDGRIALRIDHRAPFFPLERPPVVIEDHLFGAWTGRMGELHLTANLSYDYSPPNSYLSDPDLIPGHHGRWLVQNEHLLLLPGPPALGPYDFDIISEGEAIILDGEIATFTPASSLPTSDDGA